ncbi:MAG: hypothetical protein QXI12_11945 [Candidatus Methanomethyliaceae archaeon]
MTKRILITLIFLLAVAAVAAFGPAIQISWTNVGAASTGAQGIVITQATVSFSSIAMGTANQQDAVTLYLPNLVNQSFNPVPATWPEIWQGIQFTGFNPVETEIAGADQDTPIVGVDPSLVSTWKQQAAAAGLSTSTVDQFLNLIHEGDQFAAAHYGWTGTIAPAVSVQPPVTTTSAQTPAPQPPTATPTSQPGPGTISSPISTQVTTPTGTVTVPDVAKETPAPTIPPGTKPGAVLSTTPTKPANPYPIAKMETPKSLADVMPEKKVPAAEVRRIEAHERAVRAASNRKPLTAWERAEQVIGILVILAGLVLGGRVLARRIREARKAAKIQSILGPGPGR